VGGQQAASKEVGMRTTGKLFGRATSLWVALIASALNLLVVLSVVTLDGVQIGSINAFALIVIGILANEENPTTAGTFSGTTETPEITIKKTSA
jgi:4-hydroxybenzoate polyprenyltransferase